MLVYQRVSYDIPKESTKSLFLHAQNLYFAIFAAGFPTPRRLSGRSRPPGNAAAARLGGFGLTPRLRRVRMM